MATNHRDGPHRGPDGRAFYGSVTIGERGQIVVPAQARRDQGLAPGDKLIVLGSPDGLALMSADRLLAALAPGTELFELLARGGADGGAGADGESASNEP